MGLLDNLKNMVQPDDDEYYEDELEETQQVPQVKTARYESPSNKKINTMSNATSQVCLFEPRSFEEAEGIGAKLKQNSSVVVNLHRLPREYSQRTIDFLTGVVFALDGTIEKVGHNAIFCAPRSVDVSGDITLTNED